MKTGERHILFWKGRQLGAFTVEEIRARLAAGEFSLMHQINSQGRWLTLDEFLASDATDAAEKQENELNRQREAHRQREFQENGAREALRRSQENAVKQQHEQQLAEERTKQENLQQRLNDLEKRVTSQSSPFSSGHQMMYPAGRRTSSLAVTALVMALLNFVPFVNFISWLFAIIFGHIALSQIESDPSLEGRGMAVAALVITYILLALGVIWVILIFNGVTHLPRTW